MLLSAFSILLAALGGADAQLGTPDVQPLVPVSAGPHDLAFELQLDGRTERLLLDRVDVRAKDHVLLVETRAGVQAVTPAPPATYRGQLAGVPGSRVAAVFRDGRLTAMVEAGAWWSIEPDALAGRGLAGGHRVRSSDNWDDFGAHSCGVQDSAFGPDFFAPDSTAPETSFASGTAPELEVALDSDYEYYLDFGADVTQTADRMEGLLLFTSMVYENQTDLQFRASATVVRTDPGAASYPYSDTTLASCAGGSTNYDGCFAPVWGVVGAPHHDFMHFFTGRDLLAGYAGVARFHAPCAIATPTQYRRWAISENTAPNSALELMAHEIGHNMGLAHTSISSVMKTGLGGNLTFIPVHITQIISKVASLQSSGCIDTSATPTDAPVLASVSPDPVEARAGLEVTLTGQNLTGVYELEFAGDAIGEHLIEHLSDTELRFPLPNPPASNLGTNTLLARNGGGTGTLDVEVVAVSPIDLTVDGFLNLLIMNVYSGPGDIVAIGYGATDTVFDYGTWTILTDWNLITILTLDALGNSGQLAEQVDPAMMGTTIYVQAVGTDGVFRTSTVPLEYCVDC